MLRWLKETDRIVSFEWVHGSVWGEERKGAFVKKGSPPDFIFKWGANTEDGRIQFIKSTKNGGIIITMFEIRNL